MSLLLTGLSCSQQPEAAAPLRITAASLRLEPLLEVEVSVDATRGGSPDLAAKQAMTERIAALAGPEPSDPGEGPPRESGPDWRVWARAEAGSAAIETEAEAILVHAVRSDSGATVWLLNRTSQKVLTRLQTRLPRGVYKIERLTFSPSMPPAGSEAAETGRGTVGLERLEGRDLAASGVIRKPVWLGPEQVTLVRFTDVARATKQAMREAQQSLNSLAVTAQRPASKLRRILNEGSPYLSGLSAPEGRRGSAARRLNCIHKLLLLTAQGQSVHRNNQARRTVQEEPGALVMGALERLRDALAETSAILLGLVPQIAVTADAGDSSNKRQLLTTREAQEETAPAPEAVMIVTLTLANTGASSIGSVKLGLDTADLPSGLTCDPVDPAVFGTLRPGQTVRASFRLRNTTRMVVPRHRLVGDISYFAAGAAAHLRPRAW